MLRRADDSGGWSTTIIGSWRAQLALLMQRYGRLLPVLVLLTSAALLVDVAPAGAVYVRGKRVLARPRANTEIVMSGTGAGQGVTGFIANPSNPFDPTTGYPSGNPPTGPGSGWSSKDEGFAGIIYGSPVGGGAALRLYCIDIDTVTYNGIGYALDTWDAANVPNVGFVARILNDYYPNSNEPAGLTTNQKAAAVQSAIWFFSDRYVLNTSDSLRSDVVRIVDHVISQGPLVEPPPPSLTLSPDHLSGPAGKPLGPFTVTTDHPPATVTATGASMFSNRAGTDLIPDGATVRDGQDIWLRSSGLPTAVLQATARATVPSGNVYLYDGRAHDVTDAQKLILAETATLTTTVRSTVDFVPSGSLTVTKTIAGPAAGSQGRVVIHVGCDDGVRRPPFVILAGSPAGTRERTYSDIAAGTVCTVTETSTGSVVGTDVVVTGGGQQVTIRSDETVTAHITDTYTHIGSLLVRKTIAGPAAGQQGQVVIHTVCDGTALSPDVVIPAGTPAGDETMQYDQIPAPATCTVTETADGHTSTVSVVVTGSGQDVAVAPGEIAEADVSDTYGLAAGQLEVTKTITGPLAGQQGQVVIHTVCDGTALVPDLVIPSGATGDQSEIYSGIPTPASCVVTETATGATSTVSAVVIGSPQTVTIAPGGEGAAHITDTYGAAPGSLLVTKTISGPLAGQQGPVTIQVVCNGAALSPDFVIPARTPAGNFSQSYDGIVAGSVCTITETADGVTDTVTATVSGSSQSVTVPAGEVLPVNIVDTYLRTPAPAPDIPDTTDGFLRVTKAITGPAAGQQGPIAILVDCRGIAHDYAFLISAGHRAGTVSRVFPEIPAGTRCTVAETRNGKTGTVTVTASKRTTVTIPASRGVTVRLTDTFAGAQAVAVTG